MSPRRILLLGPALALGALVAGIGLACVSWSVDLPSVSGFVSRGLCDTYGIALSARGTTEISLLPLPRLEFHGIRLTAGSPDGPVLADGGRLAMQLSLSSLLWGRADLVSLTLEGATLSLPQKDDRRWAGPLERLAAQLGSGDTGHPRRITLVNATLAAGPGDDASQSASDVDLVLSWPLWSDALHGAGGLTWRGVQARFSVTDLRPGELAGGGESPFTANASWEAGSASAAGSVSARDGVSLSGQGSLQTRSLPETLAWIGSGVALSPMIEDVAIEGSFEATRAALRMPSVRVSAGGNVLEGAGSVTVGAGRPSVQATLATDSLNLGPLLAGGLRVSGLDGSAEGWGRGSLDLAPLVGGDLDLRLSAASARLGPVLLDDLAASVIVREDRIDATLGRATIQSGVLKGRGTLARAGDSGTELKLQGSFGRIDLAALLIDLGQTGWMLGATQGAFALEGSGRDAESLVRRIKGRASLAVEGGAIAGLDLSDVIHRGGTLAQGSLARRNGRTPFDRAGVSLTFTAGVGEIVEGTLAARTLSANLRGQISLPERLFRARAELLPRTAAAGEAVATPATLFEIAGPWDAVAVQAAPRKDGTTLPTPVRAYGP